MKTILVVGGAGYIGSHTVKKLMQEGYKCVVADNLVSGHREAVQTPHFEMADLLDKTSLTNIFNKYQIEVVMHFAAFASVGESVGSPRKYYQNNVVGTLNLLDVMLEHNLKKIIFSSTAATYGNPQYTPIDEEHPQNPINPYGQSKLMIETIFADYATAYGLKYIALRYFNAAGCSADGDLGESHDPETHLIPLVLKAIKGEYPHIKIFGTDYNTPDGTCLRDYIHVEDLAMAHCLALNNLDNYSGHLNLGTGLKTSVKEIITAAEKITGRTCPIESGPRRPGDPPILYTTNGKAEKILNWSPRYTDIADILSTAWQWERCPKF